MPQNDDDKGPVSASSGVLNKPFAEQVAFFRGKLGNLVPTARWDDIAHEEHDTAFMVAGAMKADLLTDLAAAVDRGIAEGQTLETFRKDFRHIVETRGWHGWTGEGSRAGEAWRTRTIYRTNVATSYAAGRMAQLLDGDFPLWVYRHGGSREPRPEHLLLDGLVRPPEDPVWLTIAPPNGWGCSCYLVGARSEKGARRVGGDPDKPLPPTWQRAAAKGWGYAPGRSAARMVQVMADKVRHWDYAIAKAYMSEVPEGQRDALAQAYRQLPSVAEDVRRYASNVLDGQDDVAPVRTLGLLTSVQADEVEQLKGGLDVRLFDFSIDRNAVLHVAKEHGDEAREAARGQYGIAAADYAELPAIIAAADAWRDGGASWYSKLPLIEVSKRLGGQEYVTLWEVRRGRKTLALQSFFIRRRRDGD